MPGYDQIHQTYHTKEFQNITEMTVTHFYTPEEHTTRTGQSRHKYRLSSQHLLPYQYSYREKNNKHVRRTLKHPPSKKQQHQKQTNKQK